LYRLKQDFRDHAVHKLLRSESSYFIFDPSVENLSLVSDLLNAVVSYLSGEFGSFLFVEVEIAIQNTNTQEQETKPRFTINQPSKRKIETVADTLLQELLTYRFNRFYAEVEKKISHGEFYNKLTDFIPARSLKQKQCYSLGISLNTFFINSETSATFPLTFRRFHRFFSKSLRRSLYHFIRYYCTSRPKNYLALGKRSFAKNVHDIDNTIADIDQKFNLLFLVTPYNVDEAWKEFTKSHYNRAPVFRYKPVPIEPSQLKRQLYKMDLSAIDDPVLYQIFSDKQTELDRQISLIQDRSTKRFLYESFQLFGKVSDEFYRTALYILDRTESNDEEKSTQKYLTAKQIKTRAESVIKRYRQKYSEFESRVFIDNSVSGILVSRGDLYIGRKTKVRSSRIESLLNHEIGTHCITYYNGSAQPIKLLQSGFAQYEELQEAIAVFAEFLTGGLTIPRLRLLAARVIAIYEMSSSAGFVDTFRLLTEKFQFTKNLAFIIAMRTYRGGGFTKDAVYLKGFLRLLTYLSENRNWKHLFYGKVSFEQLPLIHELEARNILKPIPLIPDYMTQLHRAKQLFSQNELDEYTKIDLLIELIS
jgi:uncharacterized protein (TIGR02421 family)